LRAMYMMLSFSYKIDKVSLDMEKVRPFNHPVRRLVALSYIIIDKNVEGYLEDFLSMWRRFWPLGKWNKLREFFIEQLPNPQDAYWNEHFSFSSQDSCKHLPLMGTSIKQEILINTILPYLYGEIHHKVKYSKEEIEAFQNFYAIFSASDKGKTRYLTHRFFGDHSNGILLKRADLEQGAYQLHADFCVHFESSCEGCPFVERFKGVNSTQR
jgi:Protein of unknown function (DUF2851)